MEYVTFKTVITANDRFKAQYNKYMRRAALAAVLLTILFFLPSSSARTTPEMARASQLEGTVVVKVQVGPDGSVLQAVVLTPVHPLLDKEAVKAAKRCKFQPGRQRGIAVKAWMAIPFAFRLH
ncbi:MAG: energy transducer TonB [bacterium]|nr:energy transducer TonB [bacterium]